MAGARPDILERCPGEKVRFESLGAAILIAGVLPLIGMFFALHEVLRLDVVPALALSFAWGLVIVSLDRWLVVSTEPGDRRMLVAALPRLMLALLLGFVISTPLILQMFRPEIDSQLAVIQRDRAAQFSSQVADGALSREIAHQRATVEAYQQVIASGGEETLDPSADPTIQALRTQLQRAQATANSAYERWQCELYGGPGCVAGNGSLALAAEQSYQQALQGVNSINNAINTREAVLMQQSHHAATLRLAEATQNLPSAQALLARDLNTLAEQEKQFTASNDSLGLLAQLEALDQLSAQSAALNAARYLIFFLIVAIECLPVTVSLLQRPGNYEKFLALSRQQELRTTRPLFEATAQLGLEQMQEHMTELPVTPDDQDAYDHALRAMPDMRAVSPPDNDITHRLPTDQCQNGNRYYYPAAVSLEHASDFLQV